MLGLIVAGYVCWEMYVAGVLGNDWYFIAPIVAGCVATWMLRRLDWLCTILRQMARIAFVGVFLVAVYYFFKTVSGQ